MQALWTGILDFLKKHGAYNHSFLDDEAFPTITRDRILSPPTA
jgi:hypothetical protein